MYWYEVVKTNEPYFEVETPVLNPKLGGAAARPFITNHTTLKRYFF